MAIVYVTIPWWIALTAGVVGAFFGTAVGIFSTIWAGPPLSKTMPANSERHGAVLPLSSSAWPRSWSGAWSAVFHPIVPSNWLEQATSFHLFSAGTDASPHLPRISDRTPGVPSPSSSPNGR